MTDPTLFASPVAPWERIDLGALSVHQTPALATLPGVVQGFTTRRGGVSLPPYDSLNLGTHVGDDRDHVLMNRRRLWDSLGYAETQIAMADQVHGDLVTVVTEGSLAPAAGADALVTASPGVLLMLGFADCVPVYLVDPEKRVVGLAHAGWRGTAANIAAKTLGTMAREFGCRPEACVAAIGPSIAGVSYVVGGEVAGVFRDLARDLGAEDAAAPSAAAPSAEAPGKVHLDLRRILLGQLAAAGVRPENIAVSGEDTCRNGHDFFSYRRDGATGRMAAYLGVRPAPISLTNGVALQRLQDGRIRERIGVLPQ